MSGIFYSVATPIGNLQDITKRAVDVLSSVDIILCEDTRTSKVLLDKYNISTELISYHKFNEQKRTSSIVDMLKEGKNIALISDAGTPCISDPGGILLEALYDEGIKVVPIPGACAVVSLLSALPRESEPFTFVGFLPRKFEEQKELIEKYPKENIVFYEAPKRIAKTLLNLGKILGAERKIAIGRELTKKFEEIKIGAIGDFAQNYEENAPKGEFVCMIYGKNEACRDDDSIKIKIKKLKEKNFSDKDIAIILSQLFDYSKNEIYNLILNL